MKVDGASATAEVALTGGTLNGQSVEVGLTKDGDQPAKLATCFIDAFKEGSQKEVEEFVFGNGSKALEGVAEACESGSSA